ncbi:hypothetical protein [Pseudomonas fluorescens]|uniref:hypothetical protein n=1 Tax=Pseudomonas fluorescens TaxID=294 RepID=UPI002B1D3584|nr:hypothetical protein [Pseudomonas fluorescens]
MSEIQQKVPSTQPDKREWHGAHHPWRYSPHAFRWTGEYIAGPNFLPLATEMRAWMLQLGHLSLMPPLESPTNGGYTNTYTENGITLALLMSKSVNSSHHFATSPTASESDNEVSAELERIRLHNELLINSARFCEIVIKQLLHCTQIPVSLYQRMALGQLLESPCPHCKKKNGVKPHSTSLVGTLACPFGLCLAFEHCAMNHMNLVNKLRNTQAAHSEVQTLNIRSISASKAQLYQDCEGILNDFLHMLSHLQDLERTILDDLAEKANTINHLKRSGLPPEDCNFELIPGQPFVFDPNQENGITH